MWNYNLANVFRNVTKANPSNIALKFAETDYSYSQLDERSDQIASFLNQKGLKYKDTLVITSKKTFDTYATIVACWKLGAAHCFVDRFSPVERLAKILDVCQPKMAVTDSELSKQLSLRPDLLQVDLEELKLKAKIAESLPANDITGNTAAYVMFTSGSTGAPKGVAITHAQVITFAQWGHDTYQITSHDSLTNLNSLFFDNSIFDVMVSLLNGASLIPVTREELKNPQAVLRFLESKNVTTWFSVPSLLVYFLNLGTLKAECLKSIKRFIFGGEGFPKNKLKELYSIFSERAKLFNVYGPTECTCICSSYLITDYDFSPAEINSLAPIGFLAKNFEYLILDDQLKAVKNGEVGELYLGGPNVSPGYFNSMTLTTERFVQHPFHQKYRDVYYRTGDLVKFNETNSYIYFQGRADDQIKFMGYRIELCEIEYAICTIPDIKEVAVTYGVKEGHPEITCFLSSQTDKLVIKDSLKKLIPSYMIPRKFIFLEVLPKNANGKINKKELTGEYYDKT
ncbi:MAG: amino acid adenylation domain-containing protein [Bacteriovoracaceae bacterium]